MSSDVPMLEGVRVLVTRPRERSEELCFLLEDEGAEVVALPLLELLPPEDPRPLMAAAEQIHRFQWILFASPSAVDALMDAVREAGTVDHLKKAKTAAVGPQTAKAMRARGLEVTKEAELSTGAGVFDAISGMLGPGDEILLPSAEQGRVELSDALEAQGVRVTRVVAYRSQGCDVSDEAAAELKQRSPQVALFGSPRTVESFLGATEGWGRALLDQCRLVAIGPTTAKAMTELGLQVAAVAERPTAVGLVDAAVRALKV